MLPFLFLFLCRVDRLSLIVISIIVNGLFVPGRVDRLSLIVDRFCVTI
jgi:hypothetical protein